MWEETLRKVLTVFKPQELVREVDGRSYKVRPDENGIALGDMILAPEKPTLKLKTLTGFVDAYKAGIDGFDDKAAIHVVDHSTVALVSLAAGDDGRRHEWMRAVCEEVNPFPFDTYQVPEAFILSLQSGFLPTEETVRLQRLASSLTTENAVQTADDGLSQVVTVKQGAVTRATVELPPRIPLYAYRTFREVDPVKSEFLVRLKGEPNQLPKVGLLQIDANKWKHDTVLNVAAWLHKRLEKSIIIA